MAERTVDQPLVHLPGVIAAAENEWARNFAKSILRQPKAPGWEPSKRQLAVMHELVNQLFEPEDFVILEDE